LADFVEKLLTLETQGEPDSKGILRDVVGALVSLT
jgi:hypothetical protein